MKTLKGFLATMIFGILNHTFLMAQEKDVTTEELVVKDSAYLEEEFFAGDVIQAPGSGPNMIIIIAVLVVIAAVVYFVIRKRKLKLSSSTAS